MRRILREALALALFAVSIYLFLSLAAGSSLCGPIGGALRDFFQHVFGMPASYLLTGLLFTLGVINLMDRPLPVHWLSATGLVLSVLALATLVSVPEVDLARDEVGESTLAAGGIFGGHLAHFLVTHFQRFGALLIALTIGGIALIFATDRWVLKAASHLTMAVVRFVVNPAPPLADAGEAAALPAPGGAGAAEAPLLRASQEPERLAPPAPQPPRKTRHTVVMVARSSDAPDAVPESRPEPAAPPPEPVIRAAGTARAAGGTRKVAAPEARPDAPIQPPMMAHFAGLPSDSSYVFPSLDLLDEPTAVSSAREQDAIRKRAELLVRSLTDFRISAEVVEIVKGPVITMFELELAPGTKVKQIATLSDDLAMALKAPSVRIVAPIPGKSTMGVEVPNLIREEVRLKELVTLPEFKSSRAALPLLLGKDAQGTPLIEDLTQMPHLLVAGATGAGKSVCLNSIILSLLLTRRPEEAQLILIDPKMVELSQFHRIPHLMTPVVTDMRRAPGILEWAVQRMEERYALLHDAGVRHLVSYNRMKPADRAERLRDNGRDPDAAPPYLPYIVIVVDEMADLMIANAKDVEGHIIRLAQKSRAVGIHLVMATQRPSADVITGLIKANLPTRIAFKVSSRTDSRIVVDQNGAEKLLGMGDMLYLPPRCSNLVRCQGTFVSDDEVRKLVRHVTHGARPQFDEELGGMSAPGRRK
ncbi:MAG: DNA translocase FtsK 4TM domain-containing protein, partial [Planctomycetes bacterium]|nr:DNA translocase FtsK 4TM domain-containing protein [Planctomycetota bacterium]